jgi:predicted O-methyltransferase YrrM
MDAPQLTEYDRYITRLFAAEDETLRTAREEMERGGLPKINVSASEGKLLHILALTLGAKRILEVGTLGGYSTIWLARALPEDGRLITLEINDHHADVARSNVESAGLAKKVQIRVGPASETLSRMSAEGEAPFDLAFIDADKDGYPDYLDLTVPLVREGGLILADNTLTHSALDPTKETGITRYNNAVAVHPHLTSTIIPVLRQGIDGLLVSVKRTGGG